MSKDTQTLGWAWVDVRRDVRKSERVEREVERNVRPLGLLKLGKGGEIANEAPRGGNDDGKSGGYVERWISLLPTRACTWEVSG